MIRKIIRALIGIAGFVLGFTTYLTLMKDFEVLAFGSDIRGFIISIGLGIVLAFVLYKLEPWVVDKTKELVKVVDTEMAKYPQTDILLGAIGLIVGLVIAYLISGLISMIVRIPLISGILSLVTYIFMGYFGIRFSLKSRDDLFNINKLSRLSTSIKEKGSSKIKHKTLIF